MEQTLAHLSDLHLGRRRADHLAARGGGLRISTHVFNDEEDLEKLFAAFDTLGLKPWRA